LQEEDVSSAHQNKHADTSAATRQHRFQILQERGFRLGHGCRS
jgi:hypothetical protein